MGNVFPHTAPAGIGESGFARIQNDGTPVWLKQDVRVAECPRYSSDERFLYFVDARTEGTSQILIKLDGNGTEVDRSTGRDTRARGPGIDGEGKYVYLPRNIGGMERYEADNLTDVATVVNSTYAGFFNPIISADNSKLYHVDESAKEIQAYKLENGTVTLDWTYGNQVPVYPPYLTEDGTFLIFPTETQVMALETSREDVLTLHRFPTGPGGCSFSYKTRQFVVSEAENRVYVSGETSCTNSTGAAILREGYVAAVAYGSTRSPVPTPVAPTASPSISASPSQSPAGETVPPPTPSPAAVTSARTLVVSAVTALVVAAALSF